MGAIVPVSPGNRNLGADIRRRRRELGLRQQEVADLSGASVRFVRELEFGKETVRLDKLRAVLDALGLDLHVMPSAESGD